MPAEPKQAKLKRRASRKDLEDYRFDTAHARELEQKRNRGEVSCAECRRLKIKCDKQIPCQSCQRRGCAALCPNGSLSTGQGTRFVLAATEHLHRRIAKLSNRIRQLEDALSSLHTEHSSEPHPLLHEDLMSQEERDDDSLRLSEEPEAPRGPTGDVIDAFGTLSISEHGISRFFGPTGGSESLLLANSSSVQNSPASPKTPDTKSPTSSIGDLTLFSHAFPFTPMGLTSEVQELVETHLPSWERANELCETYFDQVSWVFRGVTRSQLADDMLPVIYRKSSPATVGEEYSGGPHELALVFVVFAIGSLVHPEKPSNAMGEHYYQICRASIALQPVLEKPSTVTIQTLHLMSIYNAMSGNDLRNDTSMEMTWSLVTLASHLSQTIGLHRDSARWGLSPQMVQRRRILFWDLFVADVWQSLNTGRPPSFSLAYIDCSLPTEEDDTPFGIWQCRFAAECVAEVTSKTLTAEAPSYSTIMELDKKVREFPLPEGLGVGKNGKVTQETELAGSFQKCVLEHIRETVLMYIHRSFFAQAIIEHPENPLKSTYAPSFLAAFRASSTILKSVRDQFNAVPNSCARYWTMWTFAFSAAVVFGTVVTRGPRSPLAQSAMSELDQACLLFSKASAYSIRATKALPILTRLSEKARYALAMAQRDSNPLSGDNGGLLWNIKQEDGDDELSIIAGHTRFVSVGKHRSPFSAMDQDTSRHTPPSAVSQYGSYPPSSTTSEFFSSQMSWDQPQRSGFNALASEPNSGGPLYPTFGSPDRSIPSQRYDAWTHQTTMLPPNPSPPSIPSIAHRSSSQTNSSYTEPTTLIPPLPPMSYGRGDYGSTPSSDHALSRRTSQQSFDRSQPFGSNLDSQLFSGQTLQSAGLPSMRSQPQGQTFRDLADLGLASRDSRLDERWSTFMGESGFLDGVNYQPNSRG